MDSFNDLESVIKEKLVRQRFEHCMSVSLTASSLAKKHGYDVSAARLAGLLHDYARDMNENDLLAIAEQNNLISDPIELQVPLLLHGPVGALLVSRDFNIYDKEVLEAIAYHTTAAPGMSGLAGIVYLADIIEPLRVFPGVEALREIAQTDLNAAVLAALELGIDYCLERGLSVHPISIKARDYMLIKNST